MLVEFRSPSWVRDDVVNDTMRFLADRNMTYVSVDAPQFESHFTMPPIAAATSDWAYVRFHGRNADTWFGQHGSSADRFDYRYSETELREWEPRIRELAAETERTYVLFNNCKNDYAQRNATEIRSILGDLVPPREADGDGEQGSLF